MNKNTPINFVFIGRSGSGKGTQSDLLMNHFGNLHYVSTGDLFRKLSKTKTATATKVEETLKKGGLPFDDLATTLWMHEIAHKVKHNQGFIMDGAPRRPEEAQNLDRFLNFLDRDNDTYRILLDVSREEASSRLLKRGRFDDVSESINSRLDYFDDIVSGVISHYEKKGKLIRVNGEQSIGKVFEDILSFLEK